MCPKSIHINVYVIDHVGHYLFLSRVIWVGYGTQGTTHIQWLDIWARGSADSKGIKCFHAKYNWYFLSKNCFPNTYPKNQERFWLLLSFSYSYYIRISYYQYLYTKICSYWNQLSLFLGLEPSLDPSLLNTWLSLRQRAPRTLVPPLTTFIDKRGWMLLCGSIVIKIHPIRGRFIGVPQDTWAPKKIKKKSQSPVNVLSGRQKSYLQVTFRRQTPNIYTST